MCDDSNILDRLTNVCVHLRFELFQPLIVAFPQSSRAVGRNVHAALNSRQPVAYCDTHLLDAPVTQVNKRAHFVNRNGHSQSSYVLTRFSVLRAMGSESLG